MVRRQMIAAAAALTMLCSIPGGPAVWGGAAEEKPIRAEEVQPAAASEPQPSVQAPAVQEIPEAVETPDEEQPEGTEPGAEAPIERMPIQAVAQAENDELADTPDTWVIRDFKTESAITAGTANLEVNRENTRLYDQNAKMSWSAEKGKTFVFLNTANQTDRIPSGQYSYINVWLYNPVYEPYQISWILRTGNSPTDTGNFYFRYKLGVEKAGWQLITVPLSQFKANAAGASLDYGLCQLTIAANEWKGDPPVWPMDHYMCIERMWLSKEPPNTSFEAENYSYEYGAGYVPGDLGGDRTFTAAFSSEPDPACLDGVTVLEDGEPMTTGAYTVSAEGAQVNVTFAGRLNQESTYIIRFGSRFYDRDGNLLSGDPETFFTVEGPTTLFQVTSSSIANGAGNQPADLGGERSFILSTNNPVDPSGLNQTVRVYQNGVIQHDGFTISADAKQLRITWHQDLTLGAVYRIRLDESFADLYGNPLQGEREFTFTTEQDWPEIFEMAAFDSPDSLSILNIGAGGCSVTSENTRMYDHTLRIDIPNAPADRTARAGGILVDGTKYKYVNYWIYSPEANGHTLNLCLYTSDGANSYYRAAVNVNWTGWKLVSLELSSYSASSNPKWENVNGFSINANGWAGGSSSSWTDGGMIQVDRIWFSRDKAAGLVCSGTTKPQQMTDVSIQDFEVGFAYSGPLSAVPPDRLILKKAGADSGITLSSKIESSRLMVRADSDLEPNTTYTLEVSGIYDGHGQQSSAIDRYTFTTAAGQSAGLPKFFGGEGKAITDLPNAGSVTAAVRVVDSAGATLYLAAYNDLGNMTQLSQTAGTGVEEELTATLADVNGAYQIKAFLCGRSGSMLRGEYGILGPENAREYPVFTGTGSPATVAMTSAELSGDYLSVAGKASQVSGAVLVTIQGSGGEKTLLVPVYPDKDGMISYRYAFGPEQTTGVYTVALSTDGGNGSVATEVEYLDQVLRQEMLEQVNGGASVQSIVQILQAHPKAFGTGALSAAQREGVAQTLKEQCPYADFQSLTAMISTSQSLLAVLNQTRWGGLTDFLTKNASIVMKDEPAYLIYAGLGDKAKNLINQAVVHGLPVDSFQQMRQLLARAVAEYQAGRLNESTQGDKNSGGGSGGGGRGGSAPIGVSPSAVRPQEVASWQTDGTEAEEVFTDLAGVEWARASILSLYGKGIVSPAEDGLFRPNDPVTREEFVKLLTAALGLTADGTECTFTDLEDGGWYVPYLAAAQKAGMIQGKPDGSFGVGEQITREDLAVMAYRAAEAVGQGLPANLDRQEFTDKGEISSYAAEAVYCLQMAGILSGMGDGTFQPRQSSSRAQAAKVVAVLAETIQ